MRLARSSMRRCRSGGPTASGLARCPWRNSPTRSGAHRHDHPAFIARKGSGGVSVFKRDGQYVSKFQLYGRQHWTPGGPWPGTRDGKRQAQEAERHFDVSVQLGHEDWRFSAPVRHRPVARLVALTPRFPMGAGDDASTYRFAPTSQEPLRKGAFCVRGQGLGVCMTRPGTARSTTHSLGPPQGSCRRAPRYTVAATGPNNEPAARPAAVSCCVSGSRAGPADGCGSSGPGAHSSLPGRRPRRCSGSRARQACAEWWRPTWGSPLRESLRS